MARQPRIEITGGLYHIITRGNNRRRLFACEDDYLKFLAFLESQKAKRPFYLYAYCLMPNHVHLLVEMLDDPISRVMHALLTAYSQYHNRRYKKIGHLFQGRYKAILCQTDRYLAELVRYIHLNPVRAKMVARPADFEYSGHRAYLELDRCGIVDAEPVLRHFGAHKRRAIETYVEFVNAALGEKSQKEYYQAAEGRILGSEDFQEQINHRIGDHVRKRERQVRQLDLEAILKATEEATGMGRREFCTRSKSRRLVMIKEAVIMMGDENGIPTRDLAEALDVDRSAVSKRREAARVRGASPAELKQLLRAIRSAVK